MKMTWDEWRKQFEADLKAKTRLNCLPEYLDCFKKCWERGDTPEQAVDAELQEILEDWH